MDESILNSIKKVLNIPEDYNVFDQDVILHTNSVFSTLHQLGLGPETGFEITGPDEVWADFIQDFLPYNSTKSYVYLRVRMLFDPPTTSYMISAMEKQIQELEWRLNVTREIETYPLPPEGDPDDRAYAARSYPANRR